jgi:hypothetical protein
MGATGFDGVQEPMVACRGAQASKKMGNVSTANDELALAA